MERFLIRKPAALPAETQSVGDERAIDIAAANSLPVCPEPKKATKAVKESTIVGWRARMDWLATDNSTSDGDTVLYCMACRETPPPPKKSCRGTVDGFITGTKTLKKYTAERHEESKAHKVAYGE